MGDDTLTLALGGDEIPLAEFAAAVSSFRTLVEALTAEVATGSGIEWVLTALDYSSAITTVRGRTAGADTEGQIQKVIRAYEEVGDAAERGAPIPYSPKIGAELAALASLINGHVNSIRMETAEREITLLTPPPPSRATGGTRQLVPSDGGSFGAVEGRVQTLTNRGALRFTLYDTLNDRAVSCYLAEGREAIMLDVWGRRAIVEGWVQRDPLTGRPLSVRRVREITVLPENEPGSYRAARGVSPLRPGDLLPEVLVRRLRDA
jgi:hypothetical protein